MGEESLEVKVALLEQRLETVEGKIENVPQTYSTKQEVQLALAQSSLSKDELKQVFTEVISAEKRDTRNWVLELVKVLVTMVGTGGIATIIVALASAPK